MTHMMNTDSSREHILLLEDNPVIALDLAKIIEDAGCEVMGPFDAAEPALEEMSRNLPRKALLNVVLRSGNVFNVADKLDAFGIPYVFVTGSRIKVEEEGFPANRIVDKPYSVDRILDFAREKMFDAA